MKIEKTKRRFNYITHPDYPEGVETSLVMESSAIGDYEDSFDIPGSSYLHIGDFHLNREEVIELTGALLNWLQDKKLSL
jgi:hypothetical protein